MSNSTFIMNYFIYDTITIIIIIKIIKLYAKMKSFNVLIL